MNNIGGTQEIEQKITQNSFDIVKSKNTLPNLSFFGGFDPTNYL